LEALGAIDSVANCKKVIKKRPENGYGFDFGYEKKSSLLIQLKNAKCSGVNKIAVRHHHFYPTFPEKIMVGI